MSNSGLSAGAFGEDVTGLHAQLQERGYLVSPAEVERGFFGPDTRMALQQFQVDQGLRPTGIVDDPTAALLARGPAAGELGSSNVLKAAIISPTQVGAVGVPIGLATVGTGAGGGVKANGGSGGNGSGGGGLATFAIQGNLVFDYGLPAAGVTVRLYNIGFAGREVKLAESVSDPLGHYSLSSEIQRGPAPNLQLRVVDAKGAEVPISTTKFSASQQEVLDLVVPASVRPLAPEFQRLAADMAPIGGIAKLGDAQESSGRKDLTLLSQSTHWDARLLALAATSAQQATGTGLGEDVLYALFRVGLPTDPQQLAMLPSDVVQRALTKAAKAEVVGMTDQQISASVTAFQSFAGKTRLAQTTPGAPSSFGDLVKGVVPDANQQATFANLYFSRRPTDPSLWEQAAALKIPTQTIDALRLQGKVLYLTFNNGPLAQKLQTDLGSVTNLSELADKDFYDPATWKKTLTDLAGGDAQALQKLIPPAYPGQTATDRLDAYGAEMARKVRLSFPTRVVARMIENKQLLPDSPTAVPVTAFLRAAVALGYELGQTPLGAFIKANAKALPALDTTGQESLKTLHRLYQVTPSHESLQAALKLGFTSAYQIASYPKNEFMRKYAAAFPSDAEASLVYGKAQQIGSVTFNFLSMAKQLDSATPVYGLSASATDTQNAKNAVVEQFPTLQGLFGSMDFCQCEHCRSVLSPAAYLVDLLEFLRQSPANAATYTPLDVLVGKDATVSGRRPDLAALPLTCENTNTAMPYIDLVNEILEYYVANDRLDASAVYDTGSATTDDLTAEPQHVQPKVYNETLKNAVYPRDLPFDLWIETVRGFFSYFKIPLAEALDVLRPADNLELFTDANAYPYYRAQILSETLGLSPAEYQTLTGAGPAGQPPTVQNWCTLYGYANEATALNGQADPLSLGSYLIPPLKSAKNLSTRLGLTYEEVTELLRCGFLNPALTALLFQFERFGISLDDAFRYTRQPGYTPLSPQARADFEALLDGITQRYQNFNARVWLPTVVPENYATKVLVLRDPDTGCNFTETTLQYASGSPATALDFLKINLFVRLWKKLGWSLDETDRALQSFFPPIAVGWTDPTFATAFSTAWKTALVYLAHLSALADELDPQLGRVGLLPFWGNLPTQGVSPLYAQLFLTPSVLNGDPSFDNPRGQFPSTRSFDPLTRHQVAIQGALGLSADDLGAIVGDAAAGLTTVSGLVHGQPVTVPDFSLTNLSICYRYGQLAKCLQVSVTDLIALEGMSGLSPFPAPSAQPLSVLADDVLLSQTVTFVKQVAAVQASGFTIEDLTYLLRHQLDPVGKYKDDPNAVMALVQSLANGLKQVKSQNAVPSNVSTLSDDLIEQRLSGLFPAQILKSLFALLTNSQTYQASQAAVAPGSQIDPTPFAQEKDLGFAYDPTTQVQTLSYTGVLLDWKKTQLLQITNSGLLTGLLNAIQQLPQPALSRSLGDILGVWASLADYDATQSGVAAGVAAGPVLALDSALGLSYDQADQLQWLGYRGVLTNAKKAVLTAVNPAPVLANLLNDVQQQAMPAYRELLGTLLAMWAANQTYVATQAGVAPGSQIDPSVLGAHPEIQVAYNPTTQTQQLTFRGVLTDATRIELGGLLPASVVLANLLQDARSQAIQFFETQAATFLTVSAADLDAFAEPFVGMDETGKQKRVKAELVTVFLPFLAQKLARQLVVQALAANLASDPSLTTALLTDPGLLTDPTVPGRSLLRSCLALANAGVSASYYASADGSGSPLASAIAETVDIADVTNPNANKAGTGSAHFEGYLQVPADGPYRFFAELGDPNAQVALHVDSPDPATLFTNPVLSQTAAKVNDEFSQFVQLKGGVPYHFTADFHNLGAAGGSLLVQGESLPKGRLSQIVLYPQATVTAFTKGRVLLAKVLQIMQVTGLNQRELSYLVANAGLKLSSLPTEARDDSAAGAVALFSQFLNLVDYADLRKAPAGGSDGLIDVFASVGQTFTEPLTSQASTQDPGAPWRRLANLTRRDPQVIRDLAGYFGLIQEQTVGVNRVLKAVGNFGNHNGIRRIWQALQLAQIVGIPVASLTASLLIASPAPPAGSPPPDVLAANLKNAVRSRYVPDSWRPIAQAVFDNLRRKKRDALVSYLVNALGLQNAEQLFEYFLLDPGMEPVVQTSRLRLALSAVQTFIQRCLLNLENGNPGHAERNVAPSAIDADWWQWMKRYRVWEAARKIYLFPENWMEPELRLDKTDLFQAMESALLQGDVTRDLVEDAFFTYLTGLEVRARLDVVAMYLEQNLAYPGASTAHVIARTYGQPHKYFYRTYSNQSWSAWQKVTPDIDGDHITAVIWRGRLNLFWLTFINKAKPPDLPSDTTDTTAAASLSFHDLSSKTFGLKAQSQVQIQLNWSEYFQGKWSNTTTTDPARFQPIDVDESFDPRADVYIHVSKEIDASGNEGAAKIHLDLNRYGVYYAFRVTSKNSDPAFSDQYWEQAQPVPYQTSGFDATLMTGSVLLQADFATAIGGYWWGLGWATAIEPILQTVSRYALLNTANDVAPPFLPPYEPLYLEAGGLAKPFFYKDVMSQDELTFFVQPSLTESTVQEWPDWAVPASRPHVVRQDPGWIDNLTVVAQVPMVHLGPVNPGDPAYSIYSVQSRADWATNPTTAISYGTTFVGPGGGVNLGKTTAAAGSGIAMAPTGAATAVGPATGTRLTLVGSQGLRADQALSINALLGAGANLSGTAAGPGAG